MQEYKLIRVGEPDVFAYGAAKSKVDSPETAWNYWHSAVRTSLGYHQDKENLFVVFLNTRLYPLGHHIVSVGTLSETMAHPREIFRPAIVAASYAILVGHNHPSGDPTPSDADRRLARRLSDASGILNINIMDNIIVAEDIGKGCNFYSFREAGLI